MQTSALLSGLCVCSSPPPAEGDGIRTAVAPLITHDVTLEKTTQQRRARTSQQPHAALQRRSVSLLAFRLSQHLPRVLEMLFPPNLKMLMGNVAK